jgi:hypothetical protein
VAGVSEGAVRAKRGGVWFGAPPAQRKTTGGAASTRKRAQWVEGEAKENRREVGLS